MLTNLLSKELTPNLVLFSGNNSCNLQSIYIGIAQSPVGNCFVAWNNIDNCLVIYFLAFTTKEQEVNTAKNELIKLFPHSAFEQDNQEAQKIISNIFDIRSKNQIEIFVNGTEFQKKVWHTLVEVTFGTVISYQELAQAVGDINYTRAVASAVAKNNISYLIPCHRIIRKSGSINKYRWGEDIKRKLIEWESELLK